MKKFTFVKSLFLVMALFAGNAVWGQVEQLIYSSGFESSEGFTATQSYNNTTVKYQGPESQQWGVIMGTVSLTDKITDSQSMQMRSYADIATAGAVYTNFDLAEVTKVTFKAKAYNTATPSLNAYYSTDGGVSWSAPTSIAITTTAVEYTYTISATGEFDNVRIKIEHPTVSTAGRLTIDEVKIYGMLYISSPTLTVNKATIPAMTAVVGSTDNETLNVSGVLLTDNIVMTIDGANAAMFSVSPSSIAQSGGSASDLLTVTYNPTAPGTHSATLRFNSAGATEVTRELTGTSTMILPVAVDASGISNTGFTANWNAVPGAAEYLLSVYTKTGSVDETNTENFSGIVPNGNLIESATYQSGWTVLSQSTSRQIYTSSGNYGAASPSLAFSATNDYIETATYPGAVKTISFWAKQQSGATSSTLIQGYNGSTWVTIATLSNEAIATAATKTYDLVSLNIPDIVKVKLVFTKASGNASIDDVVITYSGGNNTPIAGSPFTVSGENSKSISGLSSNTTYYYNVIAKNGSISTNSSNEIAVTTSIGTGLNSTDSGMRVRALNGNIVFNTEAGQLVEVYNTTGQILVSRLTTQGINTIPAKVKGMVFVKIGTEISKLIMQ